MKTLLEISLRSFNSGTLDPEGWMLFLQNRHSSAKVRSAQWKIKLDIHPCQKQSEPMKKMKYPHLVEVTFYKSIYFGHFVALLYQFSHEM